MSGQPVGGDTLLDFLLNDIVPSRFFSFFERTVNTSFVAGYKSSSSKDFNKT